MAAGAKVMDLGRGGDAGGPKDSLGPTTVQFGTFQAARLPSYQRALEAALSLNTTMRTIKGRIIKSRRKNRSQPKMDESKMDES
jgi:hypothetical protein